MDPLVYPRERTLGAITLGLGLLLWLALVVGTFGIALIYLLVAFVGYLFVQSAFIAYIRGTGVRLGAEQFPELSARYAACCEKLGLAAKPGFRGRGALARILYALPPSTVGRGS